MTQFFRAGGFTIWVVLLFTSLLLWVAGRYALRPTEQRLRTIRALTLAVVFSSVAGMLTNFMAVANNVTGIDEWAHSPDVHLIILSGLGESITVPVLGFTALSLAWLFVAVGSRRVDGAETSPVAMTEKETS